MFNTSGAKKLNGIMVLLPVSHFSAMLIFQKKLSMLQMINHCLE